MREIRLPAFGGCKPNKTSSLLGEKFFDFDRTDGVSGVGRVYSGTAEVIALKTNQLKAGALDAFIDNLKRVYEVVLFMGVSGDGVYNALDRAGFTRILKQEDSVMMNGWAWNRDGIEIKTGKFICLSSKADINPSWLTDDMIFPSPEEAFASCVLNVTIDKLRVYEIGSKDTTIFFQKHGRTPDQTKAG